MKRLIYLSMALSMLWTTSCKQEEKPQADKRIQFTFANPPQGGKIGGRASSTIDPQSLMVTIQDDAGNTVADRKELALYKFGGNFLSLPLTLRASSTTNYRLSEFIVIDADNKVIYVTPKEGSALAHLVTDPLDILFAVGIDKITTVAPEVIAVGDNANAADYGYGQFGFKVMKTLSGVFSSFVKGVSNFELTTAHLKVEGLSDNTDNATVLWTYETDLEAKAKILTLREAAFYRIKATKQGYETWKRTITLEQDAKLEILFEKTNNIVDVYVAGYDGGNATYWRNGIPTTLNRGWSSSATSIHVFNDDVYVTVSTDENPQYWKNGEKKFLPIPSGVVRCATSDIIVREDEVHVCGDYVIQNNSKAAYWKNGERTELQIPSPFTNAKADKMTIDGSDVYIAGYVLTWNTSLLTAALWKNGRFIPLPVPTNYAVSRAIGVKVSSGHTYVSGYITTTPYPPNSIRAVYWKDGVMQYVEPAKQSYAGALDVESNDVYIPYTADGKAYYWKNGQQVLVDERAPLIYGLMVSNSDVYMAGTYVTSPTDRAVASYWVNGKRVLLQSEKASQAVSIFVVKR